MPYQLPGTQQPQPQQPNPYQQPFQQQFMPPPQRQFSMPSPQQQQQQGLYDLMRGVNTTNLGQQQTNMPPRDIYYPGIPDFVVPFASNAQQGQQQFNPETYQRNPNLQKPYTPQRQMTPEQQRMQNIAGIHSPDYYQQQQSQQQYFRPQQQQQYFRPQQMQQDPFQNSIRNQQLALQQQAMRSQQQQRTQANTASAARQQAVQRAAQQAANAPAPIYNAPDWQAG
jgi:hypothetical protein